MRVCIIPARGGSKRIPKKNIRLFCGQPIIAYSIKNAVESRIFDKVVVSSDSEEILEIAQNIGAQPLKRPSELSDDYATTHAVISHSIQALNALEDDWVCCLYATAPLLHSKKLQEAFSLAQKYPNSYTFSSVEFSYTPFRAFSIEDGISKMLFKDLFTKRSQDLPKVFHDAGQFYFAKSKIWLSRDNIFENSTPFVLSSLEVQDIDTLEDWEIAEIKYKRLQSH